MNFKNYFHQLSRVAFAVRFCAGVLLIVWLPGNAIAIVCGDTITATTQLTADLNCANGTAVKI